MKLRSIIKMIKRKTKGSLAVAIEEGMKVESGVTVMGGCEFGTEPYLITLRKNCRISFDVAFITHDGATWAFRNTWDKYADVVKYGKIEVGEDSFIGARSIVMPGVKIGRNCIVGAGSIVTKNVPDETVVCGVPAKKACSTLEYAEKCLSMMADDFDVKQYNNAKRDYLLKHIQ